MRARIAADVHAWWYNNLTSNGFRDNSIAGASYLNNIESGLLHPIYFFTMSFCATQPFPELSLTGQDVNEFLDLFIPVHRILDPFGFWAWVVPQIEPLTRRLGLTPSFQAVLSFATDVANRHLGSLGYFSRIPRPGSQIPRPDVLPVLAFFAYAMGGVGNHRFRQNDGVVSTASMDGPHGGRMPINNAGGRFAAELDQHGPARMKGIYWNFGSNSTIDHADQIGVFTDPVTVRAFSLSVLILRSIDHIPLPDPAYGDTERRGGNNVQVVCRTNGTHFGVVIPSRVGTMLGVSTRPKKRVETPG
jgi:hypothetical protein